MVFHLDYSVHRPGSVNARATAVFVSRGAALHLHFQLADRSSTIEPEVLHRGALPVSFVLLPIVVALCYDTVALPRQGPGNLLSIDPRDAAAKSVVSLGRRRHRRWSGRSSQRVARGCAVVNVLPMSCRCPAHGLAGVAPVALRSTSPARTPSRTAAPVRRSSPAPGEWRAVRAPCPRSWYAPRRGS